MRLQEQPLAGAPWAAGRTACAAFETRPRPPAAACFWPPPPRAGRWIRAAACGCTTGDRWRRSWLGRAPATSFTPTGQRALLQGGCQTCERLRARPPALANAPQAGGQLLCRLHADRIAGQVAQHGRAVCGCAAAGCRGSRTTWQHQALQVVAAAGVGVSDRARAHKGGGGCAVQGACWRAAGGRRGAAATCTANSRHRAPERPSLRIILACVGGGAREPLAGSGLLGLVTPERPQAQAPQERHVRLCTTFSQCRSPCKRLQARAGEWDGSYALPSAGTEVILRSQA